MTNYYYKGYKYMVWQGYTGTWFWHVLNFPLNRILDGSAETKRKASTAAREAIRKYSV